MSCPLHWPALHSMPSPSVHQQRQDIQPLLDQCWAVVGDQHWAVTLVFWVSQHSAQTRPSGVLACLALNYNVRWNILVQTMNTKGWKGFFQFAIIINVFISSFRFIWIPMLLVCGHYNFFKLFQCGDHQKTVPALTGLTLKALNIFLYNPWEPKGFIQFEIIINVLVSSFWFIWIPMLWVCDHYKYCYSYSAGIDFSRQNLTSTDVRLNEWMNEWMNAILYSACIQPAAVQSAVHRE